jgi:membrane protease YdiL (CAAX protease family)
MADVRYTLGSQAALYVIAFSGCLILLPALWRKSFLDGVQWRGAQALRLRWRLLSATVLCFFLAMVDSVLMPGPADTPIDQIFRIPGAAWLLFAFGVTLAPFFEEMAFRGFLLPALCTAYDWIIERRAHTLPLWPDENGHPRWSVPAMMVGSLLTSVPFALMHAEQTGYSLGPFLLLACVSLVLCFVRLSSRSLAASVLVHSSYNFMLFSLMLAGTGGFKHLDKM